MKGTKYYYSNCLMEALKAKFKNWSNVKIIYQPKFINTSNRVHFMWKELDSDRYYDFVHSGKIYSRIIFKGHLREFSSKSYNKLLNDELSDFARNIGNKLEFIPYQTIENWKLVGDYFDMSKCPTGKIMYAIKENDEVSIKIAKISELKIKKAFSKEELDGMSKKYRNMFNLEKINPEKLLVIQDFVDNESITGWKYMAEDIPSTHIC